MEPYLQWRVAEGRMQAGEYTIAPQDGCYAAWKDGTGGRVYLAVRVTLEHARHAVECDHARLLHLEKKS